MDCGLDKYDVLLTLLRASFSYFYDSVASSTRTTTTWCCCWWWMRGGEERDRDARRRFSACLHTSRRTNIDLVGTLQSSVVVVAVVLYLSSSFRPGDGTTLFERIHFPIICRLGRCRQRQCRHRHRLVLPTRTHGSMTLKM